MTEKLNYVSQMRAFSQKGLGILKPAAIALYVSIFSLANESSHADGVNQSVSADNQRLMNLSGISNKRTLMTQRKSLVDAGFIKYEKGGRGIEGRRQSGKYTIVKLY